MPNSPISNLQLGNLVYRLTVNQSITHVSVRLGCHCSPLLEFQLKSVAPMGECFMPSKSQKNDIPSPIRIVSCSDLVFVAIWAR